MLLRKKPNKYQHIRKVIGRSRSYLIGAVYLGFAILSAWTMNKLKARELITRAIAIMPLIPLSVYKWASPTRLTGAQKVEFDKGLRKLDDCVNSDVSDECLGLAEEMVAKWPEQYCSHQLLGDLHIKRQDSSAANRSYSQAIILSDRFEQGGDLDKAISKIASDNTVIISQLAINYFPMFLRWYDYFRKTGLKNLLIIALDPVVHDKIREMGVSVYYLPVFSFQPGVKSILWHETVKFRQRLIEMGVNYIHSDLDAFWIKSPYGYINSLRGDIVSSIAYGTPTLVVEKWGFVACFGFYMMRSNSRTRTVYHQYVKYTKIYGHDQNAMNMLLFENDTVWSNADSSVRMGRCDSLNLDVSIVDDAIITRNPSLLSGEHPPLVFHPCLHGQSIFEKLRELDLYGV